MNSSNAHAGRPGAALFATALYISLASLGLVNLVCLGLVPRFFLPAEDAVILFQYSRHLAQLGAITFQAGDPHTEGATDFLWMVLVSLAMRLGLSPYAFCAVANLAAILGLSAVILRIARLPVTGVRVLIITGVCGLCPQIFAAAAGFAVLPDALALTLLVWAVLRRQMAAAGLAALLVCLLRPEGVVFAAPLLLSLLLTPREELRRQGQTTRDAAFTLLLTYVLPGCLYFLWRWHYFAEFFPLPFLVKADTPRFLGFAVSRTVHEAAPSLLLVALLLTALTVFGEVNLFRTRESLLLLISLVFLPTAFFCTMRLDQNVANRFFYYLPLSVAVISATYWVGLTDKAST